ncbi:MAG: 4-hydroxy-tetrahydrodipicolinate reductase [Chitinophagales bacterium]
MNIALLGYGKMGTAIEQLITEQGEDEVVLKIHKDNKDELTVENLQKADVAIEFSTPDTAVKHIEKCFEADIPVVVGTTGWLDDFERIKKYCLENDKTLFYASNFSIGVNIFFEVNRQLAKLMNGQEQYEPDIEEIHHTEKLDSPSGTAITLAEGILSNLKRKSKWENNPKEEKEDVLPVISRRQPDVPGTHIIHYESDIDYITISHEAKSRRGFVQGAVMAAKWVHNKQEKGYFEMKDLLKF